MKLEALVNPNYVVNDVMELTITDPEWHHHYYDDCRLDQWYGWACFYTKEEIQVRGISSGVKKVGGSDDQQH